MCLQGAIDMGGSVLSLVLGALRCCNAVLCGLPAGEGMMQNALGQRRSTRERVRPLQYWRNEHITYDRKHKSTSQHQCLAFLMWHIQYHI